MAARVCVALVVNLYEEVPWPGYRARHFGKDRGLECRNRVDSSWPRRSSAFLEPVGAYGVSCGLLAVADDASCGAEPVLLGIFDSGGHIPVDR